MIDALVSGKLIRDPELKTGKSGKPYCQFMLSVHIQDAEPIVVSGIGFSDVADRIALLKKNDSLAVIGSLRPTSWTDRNTNEEKHGLNITANNSLSTYDIQKRRKPKPDQAGNPAAGNEPFYNDNLDF
ncbi:MAG: single-stranded DNA-binding protein [Methylococcaceae bacterium]